MSKPKKAFNLRYLKDYTLEDWKLSIGYDMEWNKDAHLNWSRVES